MKLFKQSILVIAGLTITLNIQGYRAAAIATVAYQSIFESFPGPWNEINWYGDRND